MISFQFLNIFFGELDIHILGGFRSNIYMIVYSFTRFYKRGELIIELPSASGEIFDHLLPHYQFARLLVHHFFEETDV
jgi:hypothetical protein